MYQLQFNFLPRFLVIYILAPPGHLARRTGTFPPPPLFFSRRQVLPEYMNDAGYESHMVGKWHLGGYDDVSLPSQRGFTTFLGYLHGEDTYYTHKVSGRSVLSVLFPHVTSATGRPAFVRLLC